MIMKRFIFILIALIATLTIGAQSLRLDNSSFINTCVVQQHIDVGTVFQTNNIYISQTIFPALASTNAYYSSHSGNTVYTNNYLSSTSYADQYRRGVGLINDYTYNYIQTSNIVNTNNIIQDNYKNIQRYYCNE